YEVVISGAGHPVNAAPQDVEHRELAQTFGDELQLLAIFARHRVLHRGLIEEERLKACVEEQRERDALIGIDAEERERGAEGAIAQDEIAGNAAQFLEA